MIVSKSDDDSDERNHNRKEAYDYRRRLICRIYPFEQHTKRSVKGTVLQRTDHRFLFSKIAIIVSSMNLKTDDRNILTSPGSP
jgi:hypothetical protein